MRSHRPSGRGAGPPDTSGSEAERHEGKEGGAEGGEVSVNNSGGARGDGPPERSLLLLDDRRPRMICQGIVNQLHSLYIHLKLHRLDSSAKFKRRKEERKKEKEK